MVDKIKQLVKELEAVPEALRPFYEETEEGHVFVGVDGSAKAKLDEFRTNNITLKQQLEKKTEFADQFKGVNLEEVAELKKLQARLNADEDAKLISEGKIDQVLDRRTGAMREASKKEIEAKNKRIAELEGQNNTFKNEIGTFKIDGAVRQAFATKKVKIRTGAEDDVLSRAHGIFKIDEAGKAVPVDTDGKSTKYGASSEAYNYDDFVTDVMEKAPHLIESGQGGGAGGGTGGGAVDGKKTIASSDKEAIARNIDKIANGEIKVVMDG